MGRGSTAQNLRKCMLKLLRKKYLKNITVDEICELAQIGRRTFYGYYHDKYDLFEDTFLKEFYYKLDIKEDDYIFEIFDKILAQIYQEQDFYTHAIAAKEQNGFWELMLDLITPIISNRLTSDSLIDEAKDLYIRSDIRLALNYIERWIKRGYDGSPQEVSDFIRLCYIIHGKWQYQVSKGLEPDEYTLDKFINDEL